MERVDYINCLRLPGVFPDGITQERMHEYGYTWNGMVPLGITAAVQRWRDNLPVYGLYENDTEALLEDISSIRIHAATGGLFGYEAETVEIAYQL